MTCVEPDWPTTEQLSIYLAYDMTDQSEDEKHVFAAVKTTAISAAAVRSKLLNSFLIILVTGSSELQATLDNSTEGS